MVLRPVRCAAKPALSSGAGGGRDAGAHKWWHVGAWRARKVSIERVSKAPMNLRAVS